MIIISIWKLNSREISRRAERIPICGATSITLIYPVIMVSVNNLQWRNTVGGENKMTIVVFTFNKHSRAKSEISFSGLEKNKQQLCTCCCSANIMPASEVHRQQS